MSSLSKVMKPNPVQRQTEKGRGEEELVQSLNKTSVTTRKMHHKMDHITSQIQKLCEYIFRDWLRHGKEQMNKTDIVLFKSGI